MTAKEIETDFGKQFEPFIKMGLHFMAPFPKLFLGEKGIMKSAAPDEDINPLTHRLYAIRPFIFDVRQLPKSFRGFELEVIISSDTMPAEFLLDEEDILPFDLCMSEEKIIAYAEKHALDICDQLNDYTLTLKDICDMIAGGDFERHKKLCEEERVKRMKK